ncbi:hypothetical protein CXR25_14975 [Brevibacterium aurantiacum]|uniref:hypothetical protein n=1 Tax=Brevibacterium aurantiacum TaxID=273384 RepID=UPI000F64A7CF|nr:hypothetical protein [Brevibacterium aurantiacum]AZL13977.1 hypothetical protein CXR25_14975 [Brevibacterium aurantiacum]
MIAQFDRPLAGIITSPREPWYAEAAFHDDLAKLVTSNAPTAQKITGLARFLHLSGQSTQTDQWEALVEIAAIDVAVARMLEPHVDALGILAEAGHESPDAHSTWGVYAADVPEFAVAANDEGGQTLLTGEKAWCSLAAELTHAIVIVEGIDGSRACAVDLTNSRVQAQTVSWPSLGLKEIPSGSVMFDHAPATTVGPPNWYLDRPSFAWGGIRVAACWFGGAVGMARNAAHRHLRRPTPSPMGELQLGQLDAEISAVRAVMAQAAAAADGDDEFSRAEAWTLALRVRNIVYRSVQRVQHLSRELAGPAALTGDAGFAKADADLTVYLSQHHGLRDEAALGGDLYKRSHGDEL